jgi:hypothetical protein
MVFDTDFLALPEFDAGHLFGLVFVISGAVLTAVSLFAGIWFRSTATSPRDIPDAERAHAAEGAAVSRFITRVEVTAFIIIGVLFDLPL